MAAASDLEKLTPSSQCITTVYAVPCASNDSLTSPKSDASPAQLDAPEFVHPEGGYVAWAQVVSGFLTNAVAWGFPAMFGVYQQYYINTVGMSATAVPWIGSVQTFLTYFMCTISGRLSDAGYAKPTTLAGTILVVLGTVATSFCTQFWQVMVAQGICTGLGLGLLAAVFIPAISTYFKKKRSIALAISTAGTSTGSAVFPAIVQYLMPKIGFAWAVRCAALVAFVFCVNAYILLKPRPPPKTSQSDPWVDWAAFKEVPYNLLALATFLLYWASYFAFYYIGSYAQDKLSMPYTSASALLIVSTAVGIPARLAIGFVADCHLGAINTFVLSTAFFGLTHFIWMGATAGSAGGGRAVMYLFAVLYGIGTGMTQGVWPGTLAALTRDQGKLGVRFGMACTVAAFGALAGPPTASAILAGSPGGSFVWAQVWAAAVVLLAAAIMAVDRWLLTGSRLWVKI